MNTFSFPPSHATQLPNAELDFLSAFDNLEGSDSLLPSDSPLPSVYFPPNPTTTPTLTFAPNGSFPNSSGTQIPKKCKLILTNYNPPPNTPPPTVTITLTCSGNPSGLRLSSSHVRATCEIQPKKHTPWESATQPNKPICMQREEDVYTWASYVQFTHLSTFHDTKKPSPGLFTLELTVFGSGNEAITSVTSEPISIVRRNTKNTGSRTKPVPMTIPITVPMPVPTPSPLPYPIPPPATKSLPLPVSDYTNISVASNISSSSDSDTLASSRWLGTMTDSEIGAAIKRGFEAYKDVKLKDLIGVMKRRRREEKEGSSAEKRATSVTTTTTPTTVVHTASVPVSDEVDEGAVFECVDPVAQLHGPVDYKPVVKTYGALRKRYEMMGDGDRKMMAFFLSFGIIPPLLKVSFLEHDFLERVGLFYTALETHLTASEGGKAVAWVTRMLSIFTVGSEKHGVVTAADATAAAAKLQEVREQGFRSLEDMRDKGLADSRHMTGVPAIDVFNVQPDDCPFLGINMTGYVGMTEEEKKEGGVTDGCTDECPLNGLKDVFQSLGMCTSRVV